MTERIVRKVEATRQMHTMAPLRTLTRRKAACYLRISTRSDEQENSLENQRAHYDDLFATSPDYEFAGCYYDDGVSGTGISHRHGFQQMVNDALAGKFTLILTKSISRFGRNVVDSISTIRKLKEHGVECVFEKENIHTFDPKSSFILTIMTAMAENESMSISENVTWGMRQGFAQGKIALPYSHFLGYKKGEDGPEVVEDEADVVRTIYRRYLEGNSPGQIVKALEAAHIPSPSGRDRWHSSTINSMLTNPCYKGLTIRQKTFTTDFLTHKSKKNEGELPQYFIENSHTPIIPEETWELVQLEMERRRRMGSRFSAKGPLASRLVCGDCGAFFGSKVWHSTDPYKTVIWRCNDKYKPTAQRVSGGTKCATGHVTEEQVYGAFSSIVAQLIAQRPAVAAACEEILEELLNTADLEQKKAKLEAEQTRITERVETLMTRASREVVEDFTEAYGMLEAEMNRVNGKLDAVEREKAEKGYKERRCKLFLKTVSTLSADKGGESTAQEDSERQGDLFLALVDKVVVGDGLTFILRDGTEWTV